MIYAVQTGEFNGKPWFRYFTRMAVARRWAKRFGTGVVTL